MKWIAVILALLNVVAYLLGMKVEPGVMQTVQSSEYEQINLAAMSVIRPDEQARETDEVVASDASMLEEDALAQLKVNNKGQVLRAKNKSDVVASNDSSKAQAKAKSKVEKQHKTASKKQAEVAKKKKPVVLANVDKPAKSAVDAKDAIACYRLGPFKNPKRLQSMRKRLENQGIAYQLDESATKKRVKAVRVYLGPFASDAALAERKKQLVSLKVDHFVIRIKGAPHLQLGYFSEPERANTYQKTLKAKGLAVKADTIYAQGTKNSAIELAQVTEKKVKALDISKGIKVQAHACP